MTDHRDLPTCREMIEDFLAAYVADELEGDVLDRFERHLALCPSCVAYVESYRRTIDAAKEAIASAEAAEAKVVADPPEDLVRAILAAGLRCRDEKP